MTGAKGFRVADSIPWGELSDRKKPDAQRAVFAIGKNLEPDLRRIDVHKP